MAEDSAPDYARMVVDCVPSMLAFWDSDLRCRFANRAYETWFGADPASLLGRSIRDLLGPALFALNEPYIRGALAGRQQTFERLVPGPGGLQRHSLAHYLPHVEGGVVQGFFVQVTEVTRLKETELALLRERSEILDVIAHEVRQPLHNAAAVLQSAATALTGAPSLPALERAQVVLAQVLASVDNTLAVSTLVGRSEPARGIDTDIEMLLGIAVADMPLHQRGRVVVDTATTTRTASMNIGLMRLALRNLIGNALQYSPDDKPVTVRVTDSDEPLALVIDVVDEGGGIDPAVLPVLFERGTRGPRSRGAIGHGLGLYIVRRVMELHGGSVELARNTPHGVTMRLVINQ